jgi:hypothetical protein
MNAAPISGTGRADSAPPLVTAAPYRSSQQPGSQTNRPSRAITSVNTAAAISAGANARAKRRAGAPESAVRVRRALWTSAAKPIAAATAASISQAVIHRRDALGGAIMPVNSALTPIAAPPQPGTAVNAPARSMVSRMTRS